MPCILGCDTCNKTEPLKCEVCFSNRVLNGDSSACVCANGYYLTHDN